MGRSSEVSQHLGSMHEAILAASWRRPTPYLAAAVQHALSMRYVVLKRTLDILLSSILLVLFFPIGLVVALAVALTSPGPMFYRQERLGRFGVPFRIIKFRSMFTRQHKDNVLEINGIAIIMRDIRWTRSGPIHESLPWAELSVNSVSMNCRNF